MQGAREMKRDNSENSQARVSTLFTHHLSDNKEHIIEV
jgi:hypothetical protein